MEDVVVAVAGPRRGGVLEGAGKAETQSEDVG